jgi:hypothetical protein
MLAVHKWGNGENIFCFFCTFDIISDQLFCQKDGAMIGSKRAMSFADKTAELWFEIDQLHLSFLQHDETPPKVISFKTTFLSFRICDFCRIRIY